MIRSHEDVSKSWINNLYLLRRKVLMNGSVDSLCINNILPVVDKSLNSLSLDKTEFHFDQTDELILKLMSSF